MYVRALSRPRRTVASLVTMAVPVVEPFLAQEAFLRGVVISAVER
jgi:hypothetical protein